jgi:hypothetical protein
MPRTCTTTSTSNPAWLNAPSSLALPKSSKPTCPLLHPDSN